MKFPIAGIETDDKKGNKYKHAFFDTGDGTLLVCYDLGALPFDDVFEGCPMIENKSEWNQFTGIRNERWSVGNRVLVGDALYRAHFSLGSGTRLAMEDASRIQ